MTDVMVVEDDALVRSALLRALGDAGFVGGSASTGLSGLQAIIDQRPDLVILDLGLPDIDGAQLLKMLRAITKVPVIVVTARGEDRDVIMALDAGADDYMVKPFRAGQLVARIHAVLRRSAGDGQRRRRELAVGGLVVNPLARTAELDGFAIQLAPLEFDLLRYLAERPGEVVSKRELLAQVWRLPYSHADKTVDVHLSWLRKKLGETAAAPRYLHTVRGVGIRLCAPVG